MTTLTWSSPVDHTSDAGFRAWGSELSSKLQAAGLIKTADTGQINWSTVALPATNTYAGYEIYRFDDALQGTFPIFIKVEYGTFNGAGRPAIRVSVGTGTNGAGGLSGSVSSAVAAVAALPVGSTSTARPSYLCVKDGFVGLAWKYGLDGSQSNVKFFAFFAVARTVADDGTENGDGFTLFRRQNGASSLGGTVAEPVSYGGGQQASPNGWYCMVPSNMASSAVGPDLQAYKCYTVMPRVRPVGQVCVCNNAEYSVGTSFSATLVGSTPRTFLALGDGQNYAAANRGPNYSDAILWE